MSIGLFSDAKMSIFHVSNRLTSPLVDDSEAQKWRKKSLPTHDRGYYFLYRGVYRWGGPDTKHHRSQRSSELDVRPNIGK